MYPQCLNKQRGIQQNITVSFDRLVQVMLKLLDACEADGDVLNAKMIMILVCALRLMLIRCVCAGVRLWCFLSVVSS